MFDYTPTSLRAVAMSIALTLGGAVATQAEMAQPQGPIVLTISGSIDQSNTKDGTATFDMDMLRALPVQSFTTTTIWTAGAQEFTGVALSDLLKAVGAKGQTLRSVAINDYAVEIPASDAQDGGPIVAYALNGEPMSVRDKGPLWVVYPYDSASRYRTEVVYSRSIWQLTRIEITD